MTDTLDVTDKRNGASYALPIADGAIRASELKSLVSYDPAFLNTASCRSAITFIDGEKGILRYRGYPIEQLAENASFSEVSYLLIYGELPNRQQLVEWRRKLTYHSMIHEDM